MRAAGTLGPQELRWTLPLGFLLMIALPWIILTAEGRRRIGLRRCEQPAFFLVAVFTGLVAACICYALGIILFGHGSDNWFASIANSYRSTLDTRGMDILTLYLVFTLPALLFSPIGEEIFFRGFLQDALQEVFSARTSALTGAGLFGAVHLFHHGLIATAGGIAVRPLSGAIWVALMFSTALLFAWLRRTSGSLFPAMIAHASFNATMNALIFATLWN